VWREERREVVGDGGVDGMWIVTDIGPGLLVSFTVRCEEKRQDLDSDGRDHQRLRTG
jgi:hypothetical protein